jgi:hypothetical protein
MSDKYPGGFVTAGAPAGFSAFFDGSGDYLTYAPNAGVAFGTGDFTIELFIYPTASISQVYLLDARNSGQTSSWAIGFNLNNTGAGQFTFFNGVAGAAYNESSQSCVLNQWNHCVAVRSGTTFSLFTNGTRVYTTTNSTNFSSSQTTSYISRGYSAGSELYYTGYMSNIRIVKGTAVYDPAQTTLRVPTQLLNITNTSLLTCQSPTFIDNSSNALTITAFGDAKVSNFTPFPAYTGFNPALGAAAPGVWTLDEAAYYQNNRLWPIYDPYFNNTTLMLHGNGTNNAQNNTFLDSSTNNFTITRNGNTTQGTFTPFSQTGWSTSFIPNSALGVTLPSGGLGSGDFTLEYWFYPTSLYNYITIFSTTRGSTGFNVGTDVDGLVVWYSSGARQIAAGKISLFQWQHIAYVRTGTTLTAYLNGVSIGTATVSTNFSTTSANIGSLDASSEFITGYVNNLRVVVGTAVYTSNFTPSTQPLTAVTNTRLLTCQSNRFVDNSANNLAISITNGTPSVQAFSPFVPTVITPTTYSNWFDGTGDYLSTASGTSLSSGNFTIECWVYLTAAAASETTVGSSANYYTVGFNGNFVFRIGTTNLWRSFDGQSNQATIDGTFTWSTGQWYHMAWVRNSGTVTVYRNGISLGSVADSKTLSDSTNGYGIAATRQGGTYTSLVNGVISNLRIVVGTALYTSAFTPPIAPLTNISGTSLLTCQSSTFIDNSTNAFTITATGNVQPVASPTPFPAKVDQTTLNSAYSTSLVGGSAYFDGSGDYLTLPANAAFNFNTGDFTLETWLYMPNFSTFQEIFSQGSGNFQGIGVYVTTAGRINLDLGNGSSWYVSLLSASSLKTNSWTHLAIVRQSTTYTIYLNGVSDASTTNATFPSNASASSSYIAIYGPLTSQPFNGYMSGYRLIKGTALYTSNFAPPISPPTAITNTALLTNFTNAGIFDNTAKNVLETVGNAQISTTQSKWGGSSMYFDGTGDVLKAPYSPNMDFGTGDFTIECWVYTTNASPGYSQTVLARHGASGGTIWIIQILNGGTSRIVLSGSVVCAGTTVAANTWTHLAFTRQGTSLRAFNNGVLVTTVTDSTNVSGTQILSVGAQSDVADPFIGYIDDVRITRGYARYTTNFTPPTSQLQDQ